MSEYRKDIQILRGFSIIYVLLFHLNFEFFKNGFLGVDIFFVLSGYLIYSISQKYNSQIFYIRRINRILPAYIIIILFVFFLSFFILNYIEFQNILTQVLGSLFLIPNMIFWYENSYFSKDTFRPLLHLWSLGIEIQFYIIAPLIILISKKYKYFLIFVFISSLLLCFLFLLISPKTAFFLMPTRLWEFLLGFFAAIVINRKFIIKDSTRFILFILSTLIILLIPIMPIDPYDLSLINGHPGFFSLLTCVAVFLLLILGIPKIIIQNPISRIFETFGKYSYSIYILHFPIITFSLYSTFEGNNLNFSSNFYLIVCAILIMFISYYFYNLVEKKLNNGSRFVFKSNFSYVVLFSFLLITAISLLDIKKHFYSQQEMKIYESFYDKNYYRCGKIFRIINPLENICDLNIVHKDNNSNKSVILVGNSHADSLKKIFIQNAIEQSINLYFVVENNPLMPNGMAPEKLIEEIKKKNIGKIILHFSANQPSPTVIKELVKLAEKSAIKINLILPIPTYKESVPLILLQGNNLLLENNTQHKIDYLEKNSKFINEIRDINSPIFKVFQTVDFFCDTRCRLKDENDRPLYFDKSHLTNTGARRLENIIKKSILE